MSGMHFPELANIDPEARAIVDCQEIGWSRQQIMSMANRVSRACRDAGLREGDVLAVAAPNCCEFLIVYLASMQIGLHLLPLNWHLAPGELAYILEDSGTKALFGHARLTGLLTKTLALCSKAPAVLFAKGHVEGFIELDMFVIGSSAHPLADRAAGRVLLYTSATTGRPKGVKLSLSDASRAVDLAIARRRDEGSLPVAHIQLCTSMLYHGAPLEAVAASMHTGNLVVLTDAIGPERWLELIEKYQVTLAYVVPSMFVRALALRPVERSRYSTRSLTHIIHTGAPCPVDVKRRMIEWLGPIIWEAYGAAEVAGTIVGPEDWLRYPGTVGRPMPGTRLKILNENGAELPAGVVGAIYLTRYAGDQFEYLGDLEKTIACHRGEFITVGDIGFVNSEGFLFLCDRQIDMIIRSGAKIYPAEVENVLQTHPSVADCAVFGIPDGVCGEAVFALIQPALDISPSPSLTMELLRFVGKHLALAKVPQHVVFTARLPRNATGKVQKRALREQYGAPNVSRSPVA